MYEFKGGDVWLSGPYALSGTPVLVLAAEELDRRIRDGFIAARKGGWIGVSVGGAPTDAEWAAARQLAGEVNDAYWSTAPYYSPPRAEQVEQVRARTVQTVADWAIAKTPESVRSAPRALVRLAAEGIAWSIRDGNVQLRENGTVSVETWAAALSVVSAREGATVLDVRLAFADRARTSSTCPAWGEEGR